MLGILVTILPVFVLIALGYGAAKGRLISAEGGRGIDAYVYYFAIPALLFLTMLDMELGQAAPWRLWGAYYIGVLVIWIAAGLIAIALRGEAAAGGSAMGMGSSFGNILMMGLPVALLRFGEGAVEHAALVIAIHAPVQWVCCSVWAEAAARREGGAHPGRLLGQVALSMARNPMIIALAAGVACNLLDLRLTGAPLRIVRLLADSSPAAALFALGMALALYSVKGNVRVLGVILALKLIAFPVVMWVMATRIFALPQDAAHVLILFAALPVGVNAYLFASRYNANLGAVSSAIMLSVPLSALTLPVVLYLMGG